LSYLNSNIDCLVYHQNFLPENFSFDDIHQTIPTVSMVYLGILLKSNGHKKESELAFKYSLLPKTKQASSLLSVDLDTQNIVNNFNCSFISEVVKFINDIDFSENTFFWKN
jgi:hypothetical protein